MTCRHSRYDPGCSSNSQPYERASALQKEVDEYKRKFDLLSKEPDNSKYTITRAKEIGQYLILEVEYDSCSNCSGEATKIMVFKATTLEALSWKIIDPHFSIDLGPPGERPINKAPSPVARFNPHANGWNCALDHAQHLAATQPR